VDGSAGVQVGRGWIVTGWSERTGMRVQVVEDERRLAAGLRNGLAAEGLRVWTPILMLTAKEGEWDEVEALDNYLTPGSRWRTGSGCSSGSCASTAPGPETTAAAASG
jgi:hypothetical protein